MVSPDLRGLDRDALRHLAGHGVRVAGLVAPDDEEGERRMRQLGVATILRPADDAVAWPAPSPRSRAPPRPGHPPATRRRQRGPTGEPGRGRPPGAAAGAARPRRGRPEEPRPTPVTVVWGPTGAPGRTTVAVTLAAQLAAAGVRTLLVDLDTWGASVAQVLGLVDEAPGVAAAARASEQGALDVPGLARLAPEVVPGLRVLTGLPRADRWPELRAAAVEDVLRLARGVADHVVVDAGFAVEDDEELSYDTAAPDATPPPSRRSRRPTSSSSSGAADPVGLQRLVRAVQDVAVLPSPRPAHRGQEGPRLGRRADGRERAIARGAATVRRDGCRPLPPVGARRVRRGAAGRTLVGRGRTTGRPHRALAELAAALHPGAAAPGTGGRRRHPGPRDARGVTRSALVTGGSAPPGRLTR